ncbi:MAG TPA: flagellar hook-basal body complex protein [Candidatus Paceibacterota bacterium]|nr:flagellar hook-basal body complex protein [Candidatus Paceibacterota bacterium]
MLRSLTSGVSAMQQFQQELDVIGNNIANVNTTGFKGARIDFEDSFSQTLSSTSGGVPIQIGTGVGTSAISNQFLQGAVSNTGTNTDLAVSGSGFFVVRDTLSNAEYVTRDGAFHLDKDGYLTTAAGMRIQGFTDSALTTRGDVLIDATDIQATRIASAQAALAAATTQAETDAANAALTAAQNLKVASFKIDSEGKINARLSDGTEYVRAQVLLQTFRNPQALSKEGGNLYSNLTAAGGLTQTEAPGTNGLGAIKSGALEGSNVDLANEFSTLITTQRAFQASARIITTSDEILQELVSLKR